MGICKCFHDFTEMSRRNAEKSFISVSSPYDVSSGWFLGGKPFRFSQLNTFRVAILGHLNMLMRR
jgi:hypothetical protein